MPVDQFDAAFEQLRREYTAHARHQFLDDVYGQIEEDEKTYEFLTRGKKVDKYQAVTFDRRYNDGVFSYAYFDFLLVIIDATQGGSGIYKPNNQLRALRWNSSRSDLLRLLQKFARLDPRLRFRRALILPFPTPPVGQRVDLAIHRGGNVPALLAGP